MLNDIDGWVSWTPLPENFKKESHTPEEQKQLTIAMKRELNVVGERGD